MPEKLAQGKREREVGSAEGAILKASWALRCLVTTSEPQGPTALPGPHSSGNPTILAASWKIQSAHVLR